MHIVAVPMMLLNQLPFTFIMSIHMPTDLLIQNVYAIPTPYRVSGPLAASWRFSPPLRDLQGTQFHWKTLGGTMTYERCHPIIK